MKNTISLFLLLTLMFSCKSNNNTTLVISSQQSQVNSNLRELESPFENTQLSDELLDKKLIPLKVIQKNEKNPYKKYQIDFYAVCMCDSQSYKIDTTKNVLVIFDYCFGDMPDNNTVIQEFEIDKITQEENQILISFLNFEDEFVFKFNKTTNQKIYKLSIQGKIPFNERIKEYEYFSYYIEQQKFSKEDCGDFDG